MMVSNVALFGEQIVVDGQHSTTFLEKLLSMEEPRFDVESEREDDEFTLCRSTSCFDSWMLDVPS